MLSGFRPNNVGFVSNTLMETGVESSTGIYIVGIVYCIRYPQPDRQHCVFSDFQCGCVYVQTYRMLYYTYTVYMCVCVCVHTRRKRLCQDHKINTLIISCVLTTLLKSTCISQDEGPYLSQLYASCKICVAPHFRNVAPHISESRFLWRILDHFRLKASPTWDTRYTLTNTPTLSLQHSN
jgi:hypothetical protein